MGLAAERLANDENENKKHKQMIATLLSITMSANDYQSLTKYTIGRYTHSLHADCVGL